MDTALLIIVFLLILLVVIAGLASAGGTKGEERRPLGTRRKEPPQVGGTERKLIQLEPSPPLKITPPPVGKEPLIMMEVAESTPPPAVPAPGRFNPGEELIIVAEGKSDDEDGLCWVWGMMKSSCPCDECVKWRARRNGN